MALLDAMPAAWRALVYEYGLKIVHAMYIEGGNPDSARTDLETWRERQQEQWLRTDYIRRRSRPKIKFTI